MCTQLQWIYPIINYDINATPLTERLFIHHAVQVLQEDKLSDNENSAKSSSIPLSQSFFKDSNKPPECDHFQRHAVLLNMYKPVNVQ